MSDAYDRVTYRGVTLNRRTVAFCEAAQHRLGREFDAFPQGSYHGSTSQSAGTHDGGGAFDVFDHDLDAVCHSIKAEGGASWHRTYLPGEWSAHVHTIVIGDKEMSSEAATQVRDFLAHPPIDGLAGHDHVDSSWHPSPPVVFDYAHQGVDLSWAHGEVWVVKLHHGQTKSDTVRRLQFRLQTNRDIAAGRLAIDGNYGDKTVAAVHKWQTTVAAHPPTDGRSLSAVQARRLFGHHSYKVIEGKA